ncbi:MAG TPA: hypothetical protein PKE55_10960 [Kiritimatiellia bacterium]|nr:hypothetical protein [Kiritimatiellia bacterium]
MKRLAYYITAHGYGHGVRSCDILRALLGQRPDLEVVVVTDLPRSFLENRIGAPGWTLRRGRFDVGMVQVDSIRVDLSATARDLELLLAAWPNWIEQEMRWMDEDEVALVVADIPAVPLVAAVRSGRPALAVGNFGWDWIYDSLRDRDPAFARAADVFGDAYAQTSLLLRLPFAEPMAAFPRRVDLPLVSTPGISRRDELARRTGANPEKIWVLLSFSTLEWDASALGEVMSLHHVEFFTVLPLSWTGPNLHPVDRRDVSYSDVMASVDVVITKPGYGVLSECAVNEKPIVYTEREDFAEYPVLVDAIHRHHRHVYLPGRDLYAGRLGAALEQLRSAPPPCEPIAADGGLTAVREVLGKFSRVVV